ncbi:MAG: hypothetical protein KAJ19_21715, partial [Gammaproteobacteria bacterium]|nr:hypothetical protein [Gammaproteobacteria bacterium]
FDACEVANFLPLSKQTKVHLISGFPAQNLTLPNYIIIIYYKNVDKLKTHYPEWDLTYSLSTTF